MLGWFKSRKRDETKSADREEGGPLIAALLLEGDSFPIADLQQQLAKSKICERDPADIKLNESILSCTLGDEQVFWAPMPVPYPWSELEGPCATSWMWPTGTSATDAIRPHRSHVLVTMMGGSADRIRRHLLLTALTALAARQAGVLGVYWPYSTFVHYPKVFIDMADNINDPEVPPLFLWVDYRIFPNADGTYGMFTAGLSAIGHMEMEIPSVAMEPAELREWAMNITYYLIGNGPVLKDGDTIGVTEQAMFRIHHVPSNYGHKGLVMQFTAE